MEAILKQLLIAVVAFKEANNLLSKRIPTYISKDKQGDADRK